MLVPLYFEKFSLSHVYSLPLSHGSPSLPRVMGVVGNRTHLNDNVPIFLMTPPPLDEVEWTDAKQKSSPDRRLSVTRTYADEVKVVGKEQGLDVISIFDRLGGMEPKPEYFCDGLHLSDIGNRLVLEAIMELLETKYPHLVPHNDDDADNQEPKSKGDSTIVGIPMEEASWRDLC